MSELQHHGVLGMKWGIRRYQPYGEGGYNPKNKGNDSKARTNKQPDTKNNDLMKKVIIATAAVGGAALGVGAYKTFGKQFVKEAIKNIPLEQIMDSTKGKEKFIAQMTRNMTGNGYDRNYGNYKYGSTLMGNRINDKRNSLREAEILKDEFNEMLKKKIDDYRNDKIEYDEVSRMLDIYLDSLHKRNDLKKEIDIDERLFRSRQHNRKKIIK